MKTLIFSFALFLTATQQILSQPAWLWARYGIGNEYDQTSSVIADAAGNVYATGYYASDSIMFGNITLLNAAVIDDEDIFIVKYDAAGNMQWAKRAGGGDNDRGNALAVDAAGNVYLTGYYQSSTITFDTITLNNTGNGDIFVVKYDNAGNVLWAKNEGGLALEIPHAIDVDDMGNIIVAGRFSSLSITFGTTTLTQAGSMDVFVVKYDPAGNVLWAKGFGGGSNDECYAVTSDANSNIYITGHFNQTMMMGTTSLTTAGISDMFLAKLDTAGNVMWAMKAGGSGDDRGKAIEADAMGNSYIGGYFASATMTFGSTTVTNSGSDNSLIAKYDNDGNFVRVATIGANSRTNALTLVNNQVYLCGTFRADTLHYGSSMLLIDGSNDFYVAQIDTAGNKGWVVKQTSGGDGSEQGIACTSDPSGNIYIGGFFGSDPIAFGPSVFSNTDNGFDMYVAKLGTGTIDVSDVSRNKAFLIYPNPVSSSGTIMFKDDFDGYTAELISITGQVVLKQLIVSNRIVLSEMIKPGLYILRLQNGLEVSTIKLVVK